MAAVLVWRMIPAAGVIFLVWRRWEQRVRDPLVDLRVAARGPVLLTNAASIVIGFGMYAQTLIVPQIMQLPVSTGYGLGKTMLPMGLWMAPRGIAMMAVASLGARMSAAFGPKVTLAVGSAILAAESSAATQSHMAPLSICRFVCFPFDALYERVESRPANRRRTPCVTC